MKPDPKRRRRYLEQRIALFGPVAFLPPQPAPRAPAKSTPPSRRPPAVPAAQLGFESDTRPAAALRPEEPWMHTTTLAEMNATICTCMKCPLGRTRKKFVFGVGNPHARLMLVGEAPGKDEDLQGEPFVGRAGQLLTKILEAVQLSRNDVFICNILKCRPPNNRDPLPEEVECCEPYLAHQIDLVRPGIILALGRIAANTLLRTSLPMQALRRTPHEYRGIPLYATYHPAALLRNPDWKRFTWEDIKIVRAAYDAL